MFPVRKITVEAIIVYPAPSGVTTLNHVAFLDLTKGTVHQFYVLNAKVNDLY